MARGKVTLQYKRPWFGIPVFWEDPGESPGSTQVSMEPGQTLRILPCSVEPGFNPAGREDALEEGMKSLINSALQESVIRRPNNP